MRRSVVMLLGFVLVLSCRSGDEFAGGGGHAEEPMAVASEPYQSPGDDWRDEVVALELAPNSDTSTNNPWESGPMPQAVTTPTVRPGFGDLNNAQAGQGLIQQNEIRAREAQQQTVQTGALSVILTDDEPAVAEAEVQQNEADRSSRERGERRRHRRDDDRDRERERDYDDITELEDTLGGRDDELSIEEPSDETPAEVWEAPPEPRIAFLPQDSGGDLLPPAEPDALGDLIFADSSILSRGSERGWNEVSAVQAFEASLQLSDDLTFQQATGYWANTYVPGDPVLRRLQQRLTAEPERGLEQASASAAIAQPFDSPDSAALAVYINADTRGVQQRDRVLVQVGIQGTARQSGRRPSMNIAVVLDLTGLSPASNHDDAASMRALVEAICEAHDIGDRFSLVVAGLPGGRMVEPADFRYGTVSTALNQIFATEVIDQPIGQPDLTLTVEEAVAEGYRLVFQDDDPTAPLGSSAVFLVTSRSLQGRAAGQIEALAHASAVDGVPMSVVGVGTHIDLNQLDRIALAGQGNRRLLADAADAEELLARELAAASRVIARAARLRIRLAPGVQLVDILGSYRLDEVRAQQVRDAEQAIDLRLSRNLGIEADRGEDEDGIQIVIPAFYAEDSHVILLDVVVPGPGPVADVTIRYKDLVHLDNGVARANLTLGRSEAPLSPLEQNVIKNRLAFDLSQMLREAASLVRDHQYTAAESRFDQFSALLAGLRDEHANWNTDPEIERDLQMVSAYVSLLQSGPLPSTDLADSMLYASYLKLDDEELE